MNSNTPWQELLETWLIQSRNGCLSPADRTALNALLRTSAEARTHAAQFLAEDAFLCDRLRQNNLEALFEEDTAALASIPAPTTHLRHQPASRFPWRTLTPLAAGLVIGLFSATMVFGYAGSLYGKAISLLSESFEGRTAPETKGAPLRTALWSGDFTEVTGPVSGVSPAQGNKMLRFLRADHVDKMSRTGYNGDVYRILDVREYAAAFAGGKAMITAEASFASISTNAPAGYDAAIQLQAIETLPSTPSQFHFPVQHARKRLVSDASDDSDNNPPLFKPAASHRQIPLTSTGNTWQRVRTELRVPEGTRYIVVGLHLIDRTAANQKPELRNVSFPGQFADDIQVRLVRSVPLP